MARLIRFPMVTAGLIVLSIPVPAIAQRTGDAGARFGSGAPIVETIAGPQFCRGESVLDPDSETVGSLAVNGDGQMYFDTGKPASEFIAKVTQVGQASLISAGALAQRPGSVREGRSSAVPVASRISTDARDGVIVAVRTRIVHLARGLSTIAGARPPAGAVRARPDPPEPRPLDAARFGEIMALTTDATGNVYVADRASDRSNMVSIRFLNLSAAPVDFFSGTDRHLVVPPRHIATVLGAGKNAPLSGMAGATRLISAAPALATSGPLLYVAVYSGGKSSVVVANLGAQPLAANGTEIPPGEMRRIAGGRRTGFAGDGGRATSARFSLITGMAADEHGNLFLADRLNHRIRSVDAAGRVATLAGTGSVGRGKGGFNGNGIPASRARLNAPFDVKTRPGGSIYVSDSLNGQIRAIDSSGIIRGLPGKGVGRFVRCLKDRGRTATNPTRAGESPVEGVPVAIDAAPGGRVYFADRIGAQVKEVDGAGGVHTVAGRGPVVSTCGVSVACKVSEGGRAAFAVLRGPSRVVVVRNGFYVLDAADFRVRFVNTSSRRVKLHGQTVRPGRIVTVAGDGTLGSSGDGGRATAAQIDPDQADIAADTKGNLFLSDPSQGKLRLIDRTGRMTIVSPAAATTPTGGCCDHPQALAIDRRGNLYISETPEPRIWFWNRGSAPVIVHGQSIGPNKAAPVAGTGSPGFEGDGGPARQASFTAPVGLAVDRARNLYVADREGHNVRKVDAAGRITTVAGTGQGGFNGDGLRGELTWLNEPHSVAADECGNVLIADSGNGRVRRLGLSPNCKAVGMSARN